MKLERALYQALLLLYPRSYRQAFGSQMAAEFERRLSAAAGRGAGTRLGFWMFIVSDAAASLPGEWLDELHARATPLTAGTKRRGDGLMRNVIRDALLAIRGFRRDPGFTLVAVLTVALGIGATTAIFSVVNAVLLRPLPFTKPEQIILIGSTNPTEGQDFYMMSPLNFSDYREQNTTFAGLAAIWRTEFSYNDDDHEAVRLRTGLATGNLFDLLQVTPLMGRLFNESDGEPGAPEVVLLSEAIWRSRYGADPAVIGSTVNVEGGTIATIIGVVPQDLVFPTDAQAWRNLNFPLRIQSRGARWLSVMGRLADGVSIGQARADMETIAATLAAAYPEGNGGWSVRLRPLMESVVGSARTPLYILLGATGVILLIACANVANLLLSRSQARQREMAVRAAIGADRVRLAGQLMSESVVLAGAGALAGLGLAVVTTRTIVALAPASIPRLAETSIDPVVLLVLLASTLFTGVLFGLAPVVQLRHLDLSGALGEGSRSSVGGSHGRFRAVLTVTQVALAVVLVTSAGLLIKSFANLSSSDPGFNPTSVTSFEINLPQRSYRIGDLPQFYSDAADRLQSIPGVTSVGFTTTLPLRESLDYLSSSDPGFNPTSVTSFEINLPQRSYRIGDLPQFYSDAADRLLSIPGVTSVGFTTTLPLRESLDYLSSFAVQGRPATSGVGTNRVYLRQVDDGFFETMRVPLIAGRYFADTDTRDAPGAAIINERTARLFFPDVDPIGQVITGIDDCYGPLGCILMSEYSVVGVVEDIAYGSFREEAGASLYLPHAQAPFRRMTAVVRSNLNSAAVVSAARTTLAELDPDLPLANIFTMEELVDRSLVRDRFATLLLSIFGGLALTLASIGIYGVLSYSVQQRFNEIGIRMALGAAPSELLRMVMRQGLGLTAVGLGLGLAIAVAGGRIISSQLFGVSPFDPATLMLVSVVLATVAVAASLLPALRATRVDPLAALRSE